MALRKSLLKSCKSFSINSVLFLSVIFEENIKSRRAGIKNPDLWELYIVFFFFPKVMLGMISN